MLFTEKRRTLNGKWKIPLCFIESGFAFTAGWRISHGFLWRFLNLLLVWPCMLVSRDVSRRVHHFHAPCFPLPAARLVETLLVRSGELGGVSQAGHGRRSHGSLCVEKEKETLKRNSSPKHQQFFLHLPICIIFFFCRSFSGRFIPLMHLQYNVHFLSQTFKAINLEEQDCIVKTCTCTLPF